MTRQPKERGIIFSAPMVKAILEDRKWVTRRTVKWNRDANPGYWPFMVNSNPTLIIDGNKANNRKLTCPFGVIGDLLYVKETWATSAAYDHVKPSLLTINADPWYYKADGEWSDPQELGKWRSAMFMPKLVARIWLEITNIGVERVQEITEWDAKEEGCPECETCVDRCGQWGRGAIDDPLSNAAGGRPWQTCWGICEGKTEVEWYAGLWDKLHGEGSWKQNPWVWVIGFKKVERKLQFNHE